MRNGHNILELKNRDKTPGNHKEGEGKKEISTGVAEVIEKDNPRTSLKKMDESVHSHPFVQNFDRSLFLFWG
jgi:hypothetical protein